MLAQLTEQCNIIYSVCSRQKDLINGGPNKLVCYLTVEYTIIPTQYGHNERPLMIISKFGNNICAIFEERAVDKRLYEIKQGFVDISITTNKNNK